MQKKLNPEPEPARQALPFFIPFSAVLICRLRPRSPPARPLRSSSVILGPTSSHSLRFATLIFGILTPRPLLRASSASLFCEPPPVSNPPFTRFDLTSPPSASPLAFFFLMNVPTSFLRVSIETPSSLKLSVCSKMIPFWCSTCCKRSPTNSRSHIKSLAFRSLTSTSYL